MRLQYVIPMIVAIGAGATSGCASIDGQAAPVVSRDAVRAVTAGYAPAVALKAFYDERDPVRQKAYRDEVMGAYLAASDAQFLSFRQNISRESKGTNIAVDIATLGLTGGASLAGKSLANALSAGAAGLTGARASIAKELWFDKTLPALFTAMEAQRTTVRTVIMKRLNEPAASYSLAEGLNDVMRYQSAASLDAAIETLTSAAGDKARAADMLYDKEVSFYSEAPETGVAELRGEIKRLLDPGKSDPAVMGKVASAIGINAQPTPQATFLAIMSTVNSKPLMSDVQTYLASVKTALEAQ